MRRRLRAGAAGSGFLVYEPGALRRLGAEAARVAGPGPCLLVTDRNVARLHGARACASLLRAGFLPRVLALPAGEAAKTLGNAGRVLRALAAMRAGRDTPVVALGGGVVTDLAGFAAAIYARGVPWIAVPTTLLGMVDAAVGGKTGVDLPSGKNLAGAFHLPVLVLADAETLRTLPARHVRNGLAEAAKGELLAGLRKGIPRIRRLAGLLPDPSALALVAARCAAAKAAVVADDPLDRTGRRAALNLGHTVGHAIETATGHDGSVLHGEAVAVGLVVAARLAERRGLAAPGAAKAVASAMARLGLPAALPRGVRAAAVLAATALDKKRAGGRLRMVLPREAGAPVVALVGRGELAKALR